MIFVEKRLSTGDFKYAYSLNEVFGIIEIQSKEKLTGVLLDRLTMEILKGNFPKGTITTEKGDVSYEFIKSNDWEKENDNNKPEDRAVAEAILGD